VSAPDLGQLERLARRARYLSCAAVAQAGAGHIGGPLSCIDLLVALYFRAMRVRPQEPDWPERDRLVLSKGHAAIGLYSVLALRGYFPVGELRSFDRAGSRLQGHPDMTRLPALDASAGSLGQGLSFGLGLVLAARLRGSSARTFVLLGDGELQEGMVWEALHLAPRYRLGRLVALLDANRLQQYGWPGSRTEERRDPWEGVPLPEIFTALGWQVRETDGHDFSQILAALAGVQEVPGEGPPQLILAHTVKGKGAPFAEGRYTWHSQVPSQEQLEQLRSALELTEAEVAW
jgi:transketolase